MPGAVPAGSSLAAPGSGSGLRVLGMNTDSDPAVGVTSDPDPPAARAESCLGPAGHTDPLGSEALGVEPAALPAALTGHTEPEAPRGSSGHTEPDALAALDTRFGRPLPGTFGRPSGHTEPDALGLPDGLCAPG